MTTIPAHLGGNIHGEHGDEATWYPDLWRWLVQTRGVRSVLDLGCGDGQSTEFFASLGAHAVGIDGLIGPDSSPLVLQHDFTTGPVTLGERYDLVWSCEFLEHLEERYRDNLAPAMQAGDLVLVTHAFPGQGGHHHVNCREPAYWANWFGLLGYELDELLTQATRALAAQNPSPWNHFVRSGLAFLKVKHA
jgi:SAM-dependent methyltransferase